MLSGIYGNTLARTYRLPEPVFRGCVTRTGKLLAATKIHSDVADLGLTEPIASDDAYLLVVQFRNLQNHELWERGTQVYSGPVTFGQACAMDLRRCPTAYYGDPFISVQFYLPLSVLGEISGELGAANVRSLKWPDWRYYYDPVILSIAQCLLRQIDQSYPGDQLLVDHALLALRAHVALRYGSSETHRVRQRRGLTAFQQRRVMELMRSRVYDGVSLSELAKECGLSESSVVRGFTVNNGMSPQQWLTKTRIEFAMNLMRTTSKSLSDVAIASGFGSQSHFTRMFGKSVGMTPAMWRVRSYSGSATTMHLHASPEANVA